MVNPEIIDAIQTIGTFVLIGVAANIARYRESISGDPDPEAWKPQKALPVILLGAVAGVLAYALGMPADLVLITGLLGGLVPISDELRSGGESFLETYRIARGRGRSPVDSAIAGATDAAGDVDHARVREGVDDIQREVEDYEGETTPEESEAPEVNRLERDTKEDTITDSG